MVRAAPNLRYALPNGKCCGKIPNVSLVHLHHGVWLSNGPAGAPQGGTTQYAGFYPFILPDLAKLVAAAGVMPGLWRLTRTTR